MYGSDVYVKKVLQHKDTNETSVQLVRACTAQLITDMLTLIELPQFAPWIAVCLDAPTQVMILRQLQVLAVGNQFLFQLTISCYIMQPTAEEDVEDYENGTGGIFRGRRAGRPYSTAAPTSAMAPLAIGAGGASVGETAGGRTRSCPSRAGAMSRTGTVVRPTMERGHALAFDATGPHRGPGVAAGETGTPRVAMYFSFASSSLQAEGAAPVFALKDGLKGRLGEDYHLAFDSNGNMGQARLGVPKIHNISQQRTGDP